MTMTVHHRRLHFWPKSLPRDQPRAEVRVYSAVLTGFFLWSLFESAIYAASVELSTLYKLVSLTHHPKIAIGAFFLCATAVIPHFITLIAVPSLLHCRWPRLMATWGAAGSGLLWFYFANLARPLDLGEIQYLYVVRAIWCVLVSSVFAISLNAQLLRAQINGE